MIKERQEYFKQLKGLKLGYKFCQHPHDWQIKVDDRDRLYD
jgi:hypothetical protein